MPARHIDLLIEQGKRFIRSIEVKNSDGTAINLTGYSGRMQVRPEVGSITVLADLVSEITVVDPTNGRVQINIPAATTESYTWNTGVYDLEMVNGAIVLGVLEGSTTLAKQVTT